MANLPAANVSLNESSSLFASGTGFLAVIACVAQSADTVPRVFTSTQDLLTQYLYSQGVDYCASHFAETNQPVLFVGVPVTTAGVVGQQNTAGMTGTCAITVTAAGTGIMEQASIQVTFTAGTTIGTDQIAFNLSCDGGISTQPVKLSTATTYTIPNLGIVLNFGAGTVNVGDVFTCQTTAPLFNAAAITLARQMLAQQQKLVRNWIVIGDLPSSSLASTILNEANNYQTQNQRFVYARANVYDLNPQPAAGQVAVKMVGTSAITFAASGHTITRATGSFVTDGFVAGQVITVAGSTSNNGNLGAVTTVSATVLTFASGITNEGPDASGVSITGAEGFTFAASGFTITRAGNAAGSFVSDGFVAGQPLTISGTSSNNVTLTPTAVSATVLTFAAGIANEGPLGGTTVKIVGSQTYSGWMTGAGAAFATIDADKRIDLAAGRGRQQSEITAWTMRRPTSWAASQREYVHDIQHPCWAKEDGPLSNFELTDVNGMKAEFDERLDGGGLANRFTVARTYANGPLGAFIALSLTRDSEGAILSRTHNMAVADLAEGVIQSTTEFFIGRILQLNSDGTGTEASLQQLEEKVNAALEDNLLKQTFPNAPEEGPRASSAVWTASRTDNLGVAGATLHGACALELNGTLEQINTVVNVNLA